MLDRNRAHGGMQSMHDAAWMDGARDHCESGSTPLYACLQQKIIYKCIYSDFNFDQG
jgi:hypothetical protein